MSTGITCALERFARVCREACGASAQRLRCVRAREACGSSSPRRGACGTSCARRAASTCAATRRRERGWATGQGRGV
eukprot:599965-Pleurochrysis_carterae.AAC.1